MATAMTMFSESFSLRTSILVRRLSPAGRSKASDTGWVPHRLRACHCQRYTCPIRTAGRERRIQKPGEAIVCGGNYRKVRATLLAQLLINPA
jgi:hypothetical protein